MELTTFRDNRITELLTDSYLPIRVDPMQRPEIAARYLLGAYPSCLILTSDGDLIGGGGFLPPDSLHLLLDNIDRMWRNDRDLIYNQARKLRFEFEAKADSLMRASPSNVVLRKAEAALEEHYDSVYAGFGTQPKMPLHTVNQFLFHVYAPNGLPLYLSLAEKTLRAQSKLVDSVWGGLYRYARFDDWSRPDHAKLLTDNALSLRNYLDAYMITEDEFYRKVVESLIDYIDRFFIRDDTWGFYHSQQENLVEDNTLLSGAEYFAQSESARLAQGLPPIDSSLYARANCLAVSAWLQAAQVLDRADCRQYALATLDHISANSVRANGALYHDLGEPERAAAGLLSDQVAFGAALLDAYETTGKNSYLQQAERVADYLGLQLLDQFTGGLHDFATTESAIGRQSVELSPFDANCEAVIFLMRLYHLNANKIYRDLAARITSFLFRSPTIENDLRYCLLADTWLWFSHYPIKLALVGEPGATADSILQQVWQTHYPRSVILHLQPGRDKLQVGRFPLAAGEEPRLYVCQQTACSEPLTAAADIPAEILKFMRSLTENSGN
jgi:uncharacterized protein YyaL (SSP411 family)